MKAYLNYIDKQKCVCCRSPYTTHHHLLRVEDKYLEVDNPLFKIQKRFGRGMGKKSDDRFCIPLCNKHHQELHHDGDERRYLKKYGIDNPVELALEYWRKYNENS